MNEDIKVKIQVSPKALLDWLSDTLVMELYKADEAQGLLDEYQNIMIRASYNPEDPVSIKKPMKLLAEMNCPLVKHIPLPEEWMRSPDEEGEERYVLNVLMRVKVTFKPDGTVEMTLRTPFEIPHTPKEDELWKALFDASSFMDEIIHGTGW